MKNVLLKEGKIYTKNLVIGERVYNERLIEFHGVEYRSWNPYRSKLAAAIMNGCKKTIEENSRILYLGAGNGTTVSHLSDIAVDGVIYAIDISARAMKDLIKVSKQRQNLIPILANANEPWSYRFIDKVDIIYQDISQRNQVDIFIKNMEEYGCENGILMVKARNIDVAAKPREVFKKVEKQLEEKFKIKEAVELKPYQKDHEAIFI
jgi:fibrillarin-like pre-rRNA processing protein